MDVQVQPVARYHAEGHHRPADPLPSVPCPSSSLHDAGQGRTARKSQLTACPSIVRTAPAAGRPPAPPPTPGSDGHLPARRPTKGGTPALPSSLPLISCVTCPSLQAHVIRLDFLSSFFFFPLKKPSCTMSIFSTNWSWIRCLTCGLRSPEGEISTFFLQCLNYRHKN